MGTILQWEKVRRDPSDKSEIVTWRAWVDGGWLVSIWSEKGGRGGANQTPIKDGTNWGGGVTFYPDPAHQWTAEVDKDGK